MKDRDTLEEDLDRVLAGLAPEPVGELDWEPPLGSAIPAGPVVSVEPSEPEDADEPEEESDEDEDSEDDASSDGLHGLGPRGGSQPPPLSSC